MRRNAAVWRSCLVLTALCVALPAIAAEGRIPIWEPTVITTSGKYFVSRNISVPPGGGPAILLGAGVEHVDIDLNGFTLSGDPGGAIAVIEASGPVRAITIRNGDLRNLGPGDGIHVTTAEKVVIEDVKVLVADVGIHLEDCLAVALRRNMVNTTGLDGIRVTGFGLGFPSRTTGTIVDNIVRETGGDGIRVEASHSAMQIRTNHVDFAGGIGIAVVGGEGFIIAENTVESASGDGIFSEASNNSKIWNNSVVSSGGNGMTLIALGGFLILDNNISFNARNGIFIDGFINHVDRNVINFNGGCGLKFGPGGSDNTYGRNTARLNDTAGACTCGPIIPGIEICPAPYGGGAFPPDFCSEGPGNTSFCDNLIPGPPRS